MPAPASSTDRVQFGVFELDLQRAELRKQGVKVKLQEQPLKVLQVLLENPGHIVSRDELRTRIWPANTFVEFDQGLYSAMARLRDALGDSSDSPRFIETVARRGYRFIAPTAAIAAGPRGETPQRTTVPPESPKPVALTWWISSLIAGLLGGALLLLAVLVFNILGAREWLHSRTTPIRSIAVLPLENLSGDPEQEYFADGMTDELITDLAQLADVRVTSRTSVMRYKKSQKSLREIAGELSVDAVVEGTVERSGNRVRIRVQLIRASDDRHLWAQAYERDFQDVLLLQSDAAHEIAEQVGISVVKSHAQPLPAARNRSMKPEAYESYLRGRFYSRTGKHEDVDKAKAAFQLAIQHDPQAALAYSSLADVYIFETYFGASGKEAAANARAFANKALELNPDLAAPHLTMAGVAEIDWNWAEAEKQYRRALELEPGSSDAHLSYGMYLAAVGRFKQAIPETQIALQLDPVSANTHASSGFTYYLSGEYDRAIEQSKKALEIDPAYEDAHANLLYGYLQKGMYDQAIQEFGKYAGMWRYSPESVAEIEGAYRRAGIQAFWKKEIELNARGRTPTFHNFNLATIYAFLGENAKALEYLEKAWEERDPKMGFIRVLPELRNLHSEPRFQEIAQRMNLSGP
jgi:TolB-like protein/DNA-binding winged helix-turn-helix (wHTH) protein/Tfp pilus assembly protein PilF